MDLHECTSTQLIEFGDGYSAARRGEPYEPYQTDFWRAGYQFRGQVEASPCVTLH